MANLLPGWIKSFAQGEYFFSSNTNDPQTSSSTQSSSSSNAAISSRTPINTPSPLWSPPIYMPMTASPQGTYLHPPVALQQQSPSTSRSSVTVNFCAAAGTDGKGPGDRDPSMSSAKEKEGGETTGTSPPNWMVAKSTTGARLQHKQGILPSPNLMMHRYTGVPFDPQEYVNKVNLHHLQQQQQRQEQQILQQKLMQQSIQQQYRCNPRIYLQPIITPVGGSGSLPQQQHNQQERLPSCMSLTSLPSSSLSSVFQCNGQRNLPGYLPSTLSLASPPPQTSSASFTSGAHLHPPAPMPSIPGSGFWAPPSLPPAPPPSPSTVLYGPHQRSATISLGGGQGGAAQTTDIARSNGDSLRPMQMTHFIPITVKNDVPDDMRNRYYANRLVLEPSGGPFHEMRFKDMKGLVLEQNKEQQKDNSDLSSTANLFPYFAMKSFPRPNINQFCNELKEQIRLYRPKRAAIQPDKQIGGLGMVAYGKVSRGQVMYTDEPYLETSIDFEGMWKTFEKLTSEQIMNLELMPSHHQKMSDEEVFEIEAICKKNTKSASLVRKKTDQFRWFVSLMKCNGHGLSKSPNMWAIYLNGTRANHSCRPNVSYRNLDGLLCYVSTRDLTSGEPMTMTYIDELFTDTSYRQKKLMQFKCFQCKCERCSSPVDPCRKMLCPSCRPVKIRVDVDGNNIPQIYEVPDEQEEDERVFVEKEQPKPSFGNEDNSEFQTIQNADDIVDERNQRKKEIGDRKGMVRSTYDSSTSEDSDYNTENTDLEERQERGTWNLSTSSLDGERSTLEGTDDDLPSDSQLKENIKNEVSVTESFTPERINRSRDDTPGEAAKKESDEVKNFLKQCKTSSSETTPEKYCLLVNTNKWFCAHCKTVFSDEAMPLQVENYLVEQWKKLSLMMSESHPDEWHAQCLKMLNCVEKTLGTEHWLYAGTHYLLSRLYLGFWYGGEVLDSTFDKALEHAEVFIKFIEEVAPEAMFIDCVPWVSALMRLTLFNGRWRIFAKFVQRGYLERIGCSYGQWDETYQAYRLASEYLKSLPEGRLPKLSMLHFFAEASQRSVMDQTGGSSQQPSTANVEETHTETPASPSPSSPRYPPSSQPLTEPKHIRLKPTLQSLAPNENFDKVTGTYYDSLLNKPSPDVTIYHPDSIINKFMFHHVPGIPGSNFHDAWMAMKANIDAQELERKNAEKIAKQKAMEFKEAEEDNNAPSLTVTAMIRPNDPLSALVRSPLEIPPNVCQGLGPPGTFLTVSQLNHSPDGYYPPFPLFHNFFYIDRTTEPEPMQSNSQRSKTSTLEQEGKRHILPLHRAQHAFAQNEKLMKLADMGEPLKQENDIHFQVSGSAAAATSVEKWQPPTAHITSKGVVMSTSERSREAAEKDTKRAAPSSWAEMR